MYAISNASRLESQLTLVNTSSPNGVPHTIISFTRDDMKNTKILSADERLLYRVETDKKTNTHTQVFRGDTTEVVAEVKRKDLRPDTIRCLDKDAIKVNQFLRGSNGKWSDL